MSGNSRRGLLRRVLIISLSSITAITTLALARNKGIGQGLSVLLGYIALLVSSALVGVSLAGTSVDTRRTALLVFTSGILFLVAGSLVFLLFSGSANGVETADDLTVTTGSIAEAAGAEDADPDNASETSTLISHFSEDEAEGMEAAVHVVDDAAPAVPSSPSLSEPEISSITYDDEAAVIVLSAPEAAETVIDEPSDDLGPEPEDPIEPAVSIAAEDSSDDIVPSDSAETVASVEEEEIFGYYEGNRWEDDDFWSTFYIAGEEEFVLADGIYYMALQINGEEVGTIETVISAGEASISASEFRSYIEGSVIDDVVDNIFRNAQEPYMPLAYLQSIGIPAELDSDNYIVGVSFSASDMPVQIISIKNTGGIFARRPIAGADVLDPAVFYITSRYSLDASFDIGRWDRFRNSLSFSFSSYNTLRLLDVYGSFNYYMNFNPSYFRFRFGSYRFYTDFVDSAIRLEWGNISTYLLSPTGTTVGLSFEKSLSYARPGTKARSHIERLLIIEKESDVQILNEGREIFRRTLQPGSYRLQDFVLYTGANRIRIIVSPLDGSEPDEMDIDINYSSSLLAPGEVYYGAAIGTGREQVSASSEKRAGAVRIPIGGGSALQYDARNLVLSGTINAGLTTSLTMDLALALQNRVTDDSSFNPAGSAAIELTHANILGTTRYSLRATERMDGTAFTLPDLYGRIGHQVYFDFPYLSSLNLAASYTGDTVDHSLSASLGIAGAFGIVSWGLNGYLASDLVDVDGLSWNASGSLSVSLGRNVWLSGSMDLTGSGQEAPMVSGRISATLRFGAGSANATYSGRNASISTNLYSGRHSFSARIDTNSFTRPEAYALSADYSYDGRFINAGFSLDADDIFRDTRANISLSTSTLFADGLFTVASSIPSNFLLVKQDGVLKGNDLSVGSAGTSSSIPLSNVLGSYMYSGFPAYRDTSLSLYSSSPSDSFSASESFDITLPATGRRGFVLRLEADATYTYSGIVYSDGMVWSNASSPIYRVTEGEDGEILYSMTDFYLFTDDDGRFIVSGLGPGTYAFDVSTSEGWTSHIFTVEDDVDSSSLVHLLSDAAITDEMGEDNTYVSFYRYTVVDELSAEQFWLMLYPEMGGAA